tara:strand:- start:189 stop:539 length:351 start_codon:yes stop_codon:yes gene_type:complete
MKNDLKYMKCQPCTGNTEPLKEKEILNNLNNLHNWNINDEKKMIYKKYNFKSFKKALIFTNLIGELAEKEGHHPDISLGWGYCLIMIHTHAINGLSINDFILASKIDNINRYSEAS